jgi:hypothetical protein
LNNQAFESVIHSANTEELADDELKIAVIETIDKANSLLLENIGDESRYLLFEWDINHSELTVVVTDDTKRTDSKHIVKCTMSTLAKNMDVLEAASKDNWESKTQEFAETVRDWIHNYLTTCGAFMQFSLIAIFHCDSRDKTRLL